MRRPNSSTPSRVAAGPKTGRWTPNSISGLAVHQAIPQLARLDHLDQARALDLAAGGLGDGAALDQQHAGRTVAAGAVDARDDLAYQRAAARVVQIFGAHLGHHVQSLRARALAVEADRGGVPHSRHAIGDLLDVGRDYVGA